MAKMFYSLDETKAALGKSEDEVKGLAREGRLREFRDGAALKFKADQVERLKAEFASGTEGVDLGVGDSDAALGLGEEKSGSTGGALELADAGGSVGGVPTPTEDTALATDLGLSGSVSGTPSPGRSGAGTGLSGSQGSRGGIDVLQSDENEKADPSAQTSIAPGITTDQINIEGAGSGSGLLDLTKESDDTSLGAELLDEIAPGASGVRRAAGESAASGSASALSGSALSGSASGTGMTDARAGGVAARPAPQVVEAPDPMAAAFGLAAAGAAGVLLFAAFALMCGLVGDQPAILQKLGSGADGGYSFPIVVAMAFGLPVILFVAGLLTGKKARK
jgi:hypothetical protein